MLKFLLKHSKELSVVGAVTALTICYFQQRQLTKLRAQTNHSTAGVDSLKKTIDSLSNEIFVKDIDLGRYEYMWDRITELHPKDVEDIMHTTE